MTNKETLNLVLPHQHLHLQDRLRPAIRTAAATIGLHNQIISAQTVRNRLREDHLHARRPHRGLDHTAVRRRSRLEWANAHIRWHLALWRGVFFTDESKFSLYRAGGRQRVWRRVGEWFCHHYIIILFRILLRIMSISFYSTFSI